MGTWAVDALGNDDAGDWLYSLYESKDFSVIDRTLSKIIATRDYLEAFEAAEGLAAAEVVARLQGRPDTTVVPDEELDAWIAGIKIKPGPDLIKKAHGAIERILSDNSELKDLWLDTDEFDNWNASVQNLKARIR